MSVELTGKLIKLLPLQTGTGRNGTWSKQEFIIETSDQYPKKICISVWGDKNNMLHQIDLNSMIQVKVNIESREFNEKWYTDLRAWKIEPIQNEYADTPSQEYEQDAPFPYSDNASEINTFQDEGEDLEVLPF